MANTCTGLAATNSPATPPPSTRPSGLAKETLMPPDRFLIPPVSAGINDPVRESISNRPYKKQNRKIRCQVNDVENKSDEYT